MKAPDKIYIQDYNIPEYGLSTTWTTEKVENDAVHSIKYIRKDTLLEWAKEMLAQAEELETMNPAYWPSATDAYGLLIDKLEHL